MKECFWEFEKARSYVHKLGLKNKKQWIKFYKDNSPKFLPSNPQNTYRNEWKGYPDWMGYDFNIHFNKKYKVNEHFFKKWSHNMAYILGFWFSDGYIYNGLARDKRTRFIFGITQCEKEILEKILKEMDSDYQIHEEKIKNGVSYRFFVESKEIVEDIIKLGGEYRKSLISKFPDVPKKYLSDFIRGLWDGDGSVFKGKRNIATATFSCGSKVFVDGFVKILKERVGIENPLVIRDKRRKSAYVISLSPNGSRKLRDYIYNGCSLFLKRKKDIFDSFGKHSPSSIEISRGFLDFKEAKSIIRELGIKTQRKWNEYSKNGNRQKNIPSNPSKTYKNKGWMGWNDWLGNGKEKGEKIVKERMVDY